MAKKTDKCDLTSVLTSYHKRCLNFVFRLLPSRNKRKNQFVEISIQANWYVLFDLIWLELVPFSRIHVTWIKITLITTIEPTHFSSRMPSPIRFDLSFFFFVAAIANHQPHFSNWISHHKKTTTTTTKKRFFWWANIWIILQLRTQFQHIFLKCSWIHDVWKKKTATTKYVAIFSPNKTKMYGVYNAWRAKNYEQTKQFDKCSFLFFLSPRRMLKRNWMKRTETIHFKYTIGNHSCLYTNSRSICSSIWKWEMIWYTGFVGLHWYTVIILMCIVHTHTWSKMANLSSPSFSIFRNIHTHTRL